MKKFLKILKCNRKDKNKNLYKKYKKLSKMADENLCDKSSYYKKERKPLWIPSLTSFMKITAFFALLFVMTHVGVYDCFNHGCFAKFINNYNLLVKKDSIQNIIAVLTGIGSILIGFAFFVAQSFMDKEGIYKAKVLLYKSNFYLLLVSEIFLFMILLFGKINSLIYVLIIVMGVFVMISLGRTIEVLLYDNKLESSIDKVYTDILLESYIKILNYEIKILISKNCFEEIISEFKKKYGEIVKFDILNSDETNQYMKFKSRKIGNITDIDFIELDHLLSYIEQKKDMSNKNIVNYFSSQHNSVEYNDEGYAINIMAVPFSYVNHKSILVEVRKNMLDDNPEIKALIERKLYYIFEINDSKEYKENAKYELSKLKQKTLQIIKEENADNLDKLLNKYIELSISFYKVIKDYGGGFTRKRAEEQRSAFFGERIEPLDWLAEDIYELFTCGIKVDNIEINRKIAYLPISLAQNSIKNKDHLIFQSYIKYAVYIYREGNEISLKNKKRSDFLIDRSWRYIKELIDFSLAHYYKSGELLEDDVVDYSSYIYKTFQQLIKQSFDCLDLKNFEMYIKKSTSLFEFLVDYENESDSISSKLEEFREEIIFGLSSWILYKCKLLKKEEKYKFYNKIKTELPDDIVLLTKLFIRVHTYEKEGYWGWHDWIFNELDNEIRSINIADKLEELFVVRSLELLSDMDDEIIKDIEFPISRELSSLLDSNSNLTRCLEKIENKDIEYNIVVSEKSRSKCVQLKKLLIIVKEKQEKMEREKRIEAPILNSKVTLFKSNFIRNVESVTSIINIFKHYNLVINNINKSDDLKINKFGINTYFSKGFFLDDNVEPYINYGGMENGFGFGKIMIRGENTNIYNKIRDSIEVINENQFANYIKKIDSGNVIILSSNSSAIFLLRKNYDDIEYISKYSNNFPEKSHENFCEGVDVFLKFNEKYIPIYNIYNENREREILVLDKTKLGNIVQYSPYDDEFKYTKNKDRYSIEVKEILKESELEKELIENAPEWLKQKGTEQAQLEYLRERVIVQIYERFELILDENIIGARIKISK